jgi:hypothetical protein
MKFGCVDDNIGPDGRLFAAHRLRLPDHEAVKRTSHRLGQNGDAGHPGVEVFRLRSNIGLCLSVE